MPGQRLKGGVRVRHHVNPLKLPFQVARAERLELPSGPVELEVGCADAQWLFERAAQDPSRLEVGIEIRREMVKWVNDRARELGANVRAVDANANVAFEQLFAPASLDRVFVNFPDPWFKTRHKKRRLMEPGLVRAVHAALRPAGELFFQSDVWDLALDALAVLEGESQLFTNRAGPWSFWKAGNPYGVRSRREVGCETEGAAVWRLLYDRR